MTASEKYQVTFHWPHTEPNSVIVTGSFDEWSQSKRLQKGEDGFKGTAEINWNEKITYKFVVDGQWVVNNQEPTEADNSGNVNNVHTAPEKPLAPHSNGTLEEPKPASEPAADLAAIMAATDGTSSALGYVASGVGAAIQGVIGLDPINPDQMSVKSPVSPAPPTPNVISTSTEAPNSPTVSSDAVHPGVPNGTSEGSPVLIAESTAAVTAPFEPSTHTPANAAPSSPQEPSVDSAPSTETEVPPSEDSRSIEASTHTPAVAPATLSSEPSVDTPPATSAGPSVEASTHGPVVVPPSADADFNTTHVVTPTSTPAVEAVTTAIAVPTTAASNDTEAASSVEPTTPTRKVFPVNGTGDLNASTPAGSPAPRASTSSILSTPSKRNSRILSFPSRGTPTPESSPSSKFDSPSIRAKRKSIFGKMSIKNIFGKDKEKEKEK
ncbi:carbohydrate-binding module family 48 partial [Lentinula edodes]|uniref:Carbohydrate-binding module family 48 partial n=2 Tax=Lentinula edodes TaxID=5353 RepID=A0A1Q3DXJ6_LENED|nr:carbohydrate-binding module family 48 partial [Lentinula edodes]